MPKKAKCAGRTYGITKDLGVLRSFRKTKNNSELPSGGVDMQYLKKDDPQIAALIEKEAIRIEETLDLIAAENHSPRSIMEVLGSILNTKTIEGYPGRRFHAGCVNVDEIENIAIRRAKRLFGAQYVNVQPHSGTSANLAVTAFSRSKKCIGFNFRVAQMLIRRWLGDEDACGHGISHCHHRQTKKS